MRILVVEDDKELAKTIKKTFVEEGFAVDVANDGEGGLFNATSWEYDALVLDIMIPRIDGWTLLKELRKHKNTPVLILTARDAISDRVKGLNTGADDYLTKPFSVDELIARVRALIRRAANISSPIINLGDVEINTNSRTVTKSGENVELTPKEYALIELLALNKGKLVTRSMIYNHIYNEEDDTLSNVVDVYVANIRKKLGKDLVETRKGHGYIINV